MHTVAEPTVSQLEIFYLALATFVSMSREPFSLFHHGVLI